MKRTIGIIMILLMLMSVTVALAGVNKDAQPDKTDDDLGLQIFEKELNVPGEEEFVADEILVKFKPGVGKAKVDKINSKHGSFVRHTSPYTGTGRIAIPEGKTVAEMVKLYQEEDTVEYAKPNYICRASFVPNDPYYFYQWHFPLINMESAWEIQQGGDPEIVVAVLDTGVAYENYSVYQRCPDLAGTNFVAGYDFINNDTHPNDDGEHGTHVTGTIAQTTNNGYGVTGMAFKTSIMPVKVLGVDGGTVETLADGLHYAADNGADVISMSLGFGSSVKPEDIPAVGVAVEYAYNKGCILVASSGNDGGSVVSLPAAYDEVIAVGAVNSEDKRASYSQYGTALEVVAPGGDGFDRDKDGYMDGVLQMTFSEGNPTDWGFWFYTGTSMSAPHVSGLVALLLAQDATLTQTQIRDILHTTSVDMGAPDWDEQYGYGRIDALAALSSLAPGEVVTEFYDDFEDGALAPEWAESGEGDWNVETPIEAHRGNAAHSDNSDTESIIKLATSINLEDKTGAQLTFWRWVDNGLDSGEYLAVDIHRDGSWENIAYWTNAAGDTDYWVYESYNLHELGALSSDFSVRFRTKESRTYEHVYVDDVRIVSYGVPAPPEPDIEPPSIPSITGDISTTTGESADIVVTAEDNVDVTLAKIFIDGDTTGIAMVEGPDDTFTYTYTAPIDSVASHAYYVEVYDAAENSARALETGTYTITVTDNDAPVISGATGDTTATTDESVTISATIADNIDVDSATVHYTPIDGTETFADMTESTNNVWSASIPADSEEGTITYYITAQDALPNTASDPETGTYSIAVSAPDTEAPSITCITDSTSGTTGEPVTVEATITDNVDVVSATVHYTPIDGTETSVSMTEGADKVWNANVPVASDKVGTITYYITAQDALPNTASDPETGTYSITVADNDAPVAEAGIDQGVLVDQEVTFDGSSSSDNIGITSHSWDFNASNDIQEDATGETAIHTYAATGTYTVTLTVRDGAGNEDSDTLTVTVSETSVEVVEEFKDSFEDGEWNGLWAEDSQNDWFRSTQRATDGSYSAEVDGRARDATLTMANPIDLSGKTSATLMFSWFIEEYFDDREYIAIDVYDDDDGSWYEIKRLSGNVDGENMWHDEDIDLSTYMTSDFKIRFRAKVSNAREDGNIDNVTITSHTS